jgi:hypothetical protein
MYADAWRKHLDRRPLSPLEAQITAVIAWHPEYHAEVAGDDLEQDYSPDDGRTNPFLHMGLHLGIREQVATDRPAGIARVHAALLEKTGDPHTSEHQMIEALAETLWEAQNANGLPDEHKYLERLRSLAGQVL